MAAQTMMEPFLCFSWFSRSYSRDGFPHTSTRSKVENRLKFDSSVKKIVFHWSALRSLSVLHHSLIYDIHAVYRFFDCSTIMKEYSTYWVFAYCFRAHMVCKNGIQLRSTFCSCFLSHNPKQWSMSQSLIYDSRPRWYLSNDASFSEA